MGKDLTDENDKKIGSYYHVVSDIERIGDYAENIMEYSHKLREEGLSLSEEAKAELKELIVDMQRVFGTRVNAIGNDKKGRIYIDYYTRDDLDRLSELLEFLKTNKKQ